MDNKQLDSYSMLICSKYFTNKQDYINIICVCKKFKETTEKLRYNPIPIKSLKLFPKIQTQYLYSKQDNKIEGIDNYEIWHNVNYYQYLKYKNENVKCHRVKYTKLNRLKYGNSISDCITVLGKNCFEESNINHVTLPNQITSIKKQCFYFCDNLKNVKLPSKLTKICSNCFFCCTSLTSVTIPSTVQTMKKYCFSNCSSLKTINIPNSVQKMDYGCFQSCTSLQSITIPTSIIELKEDVFENCCSLSKVELPTTLTSIGECCFSECTNLTTITLPLSMKKLDDYSFEFCSNLVSINGVKQLEIGSYCFNGCSKLKKKPLNKEESCIIC